MRILVTSTVIPSARSGKFIIKSDQFERPFPSGKEFMRYAFACDYDGTIAEHGTVSLEFIAALERLRSSGRLLILVTGRRLEDLVHVFPRVALFDKVVAEDGGLLYTPATYEEKPIGGHRHRKSINTLKELGVSPSVGRVIVATWEPNRNT